MEFQSAGPSVVKSIKQRDLLNTWLPDGSLHSEAGAGTNQGLRVLYRFAGNANLAMVWVTFEIPARGVKRWIAPLFRWVAQRALQKAFEEDRRDLESGAYARSAPGRPTPPSPSPFDAYLLLLSA